MEQYQSALTKGDNMGKVVGKVVESMLRKGTFKVWIQTPSSTGYLRQGHAWRTKSGADKALADFMQNYPLKQL